MKKNELKKEKKKAKFKIYTQLCYLSAIKVMFLIIELFGTHAGNICGEYMYVCSIDSIRFYICTYLRVYEFPLMHKSK